MTLPNKALIGLFVPLLTCLAGCAPNIIHRSDYDSCTVTVDTSCADHSIQLYHAGRDEEFQLGFVEIDDQGQLRDRRQMQALLDNLYRMSSGNDLLINVFVHGWHHNAAPGDSHIAGFRDNLAKLGKLEHRLARDRPRKVVGIYVGWQGESIDFPGLRYLTFWDRKNTAEDVGYLGISELLLRLEQITHIKKSQQVAADTDDEQGQSSGSRLVIIGHSFGGAVIYNAASQILASRFVNSEIGKTYEGAVDGLGDLVVLLNPAFEAMQFAPLYDLAQSRCRYPFSRQPRMVILTSETDYATKYAFWAGRIFSTLWETHNTVEREECDGKRKLTLDEGVADRNTVGHFAPLITHELSKAAVRREAVEPEMRRLRTLWRQQDEGKAMRYANTELKHLQKTAPFNPYLNIRVKQEVMDGHNDIFGDDLMEFIRMLILLSTQS